MNSSACVDQAVRRSADFERVRTSGRSGTSGMTELERPRFGARPRALLLAVADDVLCVDHARVGVLSAVDVVVSGDVVARLQEVVSGLVLVVRARSRVLLPDEAVVGRTLPTEVVVALAAVELVVLVVAADVVVVGLTLDGVGALVALHDVVALAA